MSSYRLTEHTNTLTVDVKSGSVFVAIDSPDMWAAVKLSTRQAAELVGWLSVQLADTPKNGANHRHNRNRLGGN